MPVHSCPSSFDCAGLGQPNASLTQLETSYYQRRAKVLLGMQYSQIAWVVDDLDKAVERWQKMANIGPIYIGRHVGAMFDETTKHRGLPAQIDISAAVVQAGPVQIELIQQHDSAPSPYRDVYAEGEEGLHHICSFVDDVDAECRRYESLGYEVVLTSKIGGQTPAAYVDTRSLIGCMTELMGNQGFVAHMFSATAKAAAEWDGVTDPIRDMTSLMG